MADGGFAVQPGTHTLITILNSEVSLQDVWTSLDIEIGSTQVKADYLLLYSFVSIPGKDYGSSIREL